MILIRGIVEIEEKFSTSKTPKLKKERFKAIHQIYNYMKPLEKTVIYIE